MSTVIASKIPASANEAQIKEFFSFCGKIKDIKVVDKNDKTQEIEVKFAKSSAISTALLLNGAEFEGSTIEIKEVGGEKNDEADDENETTNTDGDIDQESKPKSTVIAELLANGYVLQSSLVEKAVQFDKENGISERFNNFIKGLDEKYHLQEKNQQVAEQTNSLYNDWGIEKHWNNGIRSLNSYIDKFKNDKYGSQVHEFYKNVTNDVKSVNDEALRLAELKKQQQQDQTSSASNPNPVNPTISGITPDSTTAQAASAVPLEEKK